MVHRFRPEDLKVLAIPGLTLADMDAIRRDALERLKRAANDTMPGHETDRQAGQNFLRMGIPKPAGLYRSEIVFDEQPKRAVVHVDNETGYAGHGGCAVAVKDGNGSWTATANMQQEHIQY